jgi:hypothetical protein
MCVVITCGFLVSFFVDFHSGGDFYDSYVPYILFWGLLAVLNKIRWVINKIDGNKTINDGFSTEYDGF